MRQMLRLESLHLRRIFLFTAGILSLILFYACEKELFVESALPETGSYFAAYITSNPQGAEIYINGKYSGKNTPDTVKWLLKGEHTVRLRFNSALDTIFSMRNETGELKSVYIDYLTVFNHYGNLYCTSEPTSAYIYVDGNYTARFTPDTLKYLLPGSYKIKYEQYRHRSDSTLVEVIGGKTTRVNMYLQDTTDWLDYRASNSKIPTDRIVCFDVDMNNAVWIGTFDCGVSRLLNGRFTHYNLSNSSIPSNFVTAIEIDAMNHIWIGTLNGLAEFDGTEWKTYNSSGGLPSNTITALYYSPKGIMYVGTNKGLGIIENGYASPGAQLDIPLLLKPIASITGNRNGDIWVASEGGLSYFSNDEWKMFTRESDGLLSTDAGYTALDISGNLWCSFPIKIYQGNYQAGGLMKFDGTRWVEYPLPITVKGKIQRIYADYRGNVWVATPNGIYMLLPEGGHLLFASKRYAMATYNATDVLVDRKDKVWFALWEGGVVKCKLKLL